MSSFILKVSEEGGVSSTPIKDGSTVRAEALEEIIKMIQDPDTPLAPIKRKIAVEIAVASRAMVTVSQDLDMNALEAMKVKALESQVKALRELGKELMESDVLSKKDFLNFDGKKLAFVLEEYRQGAVDTLRKVGIDDGTVQQFLRMWRDEMMQRESAIRKTVLKDWEEK